LSRYGLAYQQCKRREKLLQVLSVCPLSVVACPPGKVSPSQGLKPSRPTKDVQSTIHIRSCHLSDFPCFIHIEPQLSSLEPTLMRPSRANRSRAILSPLNDTPILHQLRCPYHIRICATNPTPTIPKSRHNHTYQEHNQRRSGNRREESRRRTRRGFNRRSGAFEFGQQRLFCLLIPPIPMFQILQYMLKSNFRLFRLRRLGYAWSFRMAVRLSIHIVQPLFLEHRFPLWFDIRP
jgi:hypothetical protein